MKTRLQYELLIIIISLMLFIVGCENNAPVNALSEDTTIYNEVLNELLPSAEEVGNINGILVKFNSDISLAEQQSSLAKLNLESVFKSTLVPGLFYVEPKANTSIQDSLVQLLNDPGITYAEPDYQIYLNSLAQKQIQNKVSKISSRLSSRDLDSNGHDPYVVAVLDTGIDFNHSALDQSIWENTAEIPLNKIDDDGNGWVDDIKGWNFVENDNNPLDYHQHGTHVAGIISGAGGNDPSIVEKLKILPVRVLNEDGIGHVSNVIRAFEYIVANNIILSNNSWGLDYNSRALFDVMQTLNSYDHLAIVAAGNSGTNVDKTPFYPAKYKMDNVLVVGSSDEALALSAFSNYGGESVELLAPGENVKSTVLQDGFSALSGTSMSTAFVSSIVAQLKIANHDLNGQELKQQILKFSGTNELLSGKIKDNKVIANRTEFFSALNDSAIQNSKDVITDIAADPITVVVSTNEIAIGEELQLGVDGGVAPYVWKVNNALFASIDENGLLKGLTMGSTGVSLVDSNGNASNEVVITVGPMTILSVDMLAVNKVSQLSAKGGVPPYTWAIDNPEIVVGESSDTDSQIFNVTPKMAGEFEVTLQDSIGNVAKSGKIQIEALPLMVTPTALQMTLEQNSQLLIEGGNSPYNWYSTDTGILAVNDTGMVTALSAGNANIIVTDSLNSSQTVAVTVLEELTLQASHKILAPGETLKLTVSGGLDGYTWASSDSSKIAVDSTGLISAVDTGIANIIVQDSAGTVGKLQIEVRELNLSVSSTITQVFSQAIKLSVSGGAAPYTWSVNDSHIASIDKLGELTGLSAGVVIVTVTDADGFSDYETILVEPAPLTISHTNTVIAKGESIQLVTKGGDGNYNWSSSDESVATVTNDGIVTALSVGSAIITVMDGLGESVQVTVNVRLVGIVVERTEISINDPISQLTATGGTAPYTWSVSDETIATIDETGKFTALLPGEVTVLVNDANMIPAQIDLTVSVDPVSIFIETKIIGIAESTQLQVTGGDSNYTFISSDASILIVDQAGLVTATSAGNAEIIVTDGLSQVSNVTIEVREIKLNTVGSVPAILEIGDPALPLEAQGGQGAYTWSSSNDSVATVSSDGMVVAQSPGVASITATDVDGFSTSIDITVNYTPLTLQQGNQLLSINSTVQLVAAGGDKQYDWQVDDITIVTISESGFITAIAPGIASVSVSDGQGSMASISVEVREVKVSATSTTLILGQNGVALTVSGGAGPYTWVSGDSNIVNVDETGFITSVDVGSVEITATDSDGFSGHVTVTVEPDVLILNDSNILLGLGDTYAVDVSGGNGTFSWSSSDESVATVNSAGIVQAISVGTAVITLTDDYNQTVSVGLEVRDVKVTSSVSSVELTESTLQLTVNGGSGGYTWSSDSTIASVDENGLVTLNATGSVTITATDADNFSDSITITIVYPPLVISDTYALLAVNSTVQLNASGGDENYTWESSNTSVAEVSDSGRVTAKSAGTATITLSDGSDNTVTASIEVRKVKLSASSSSVNVGSTITITASGGNSPYNWSSSNTNVATVSSSGVVTGRNSGTVTITAEDEDGFSGTITITVNSVFGGGGGGH